MTMTLMVNRGGSLLEEYPGKTIPFDSQGERKEFLYTTRIDPISGHVCKISEERAKRAIAISVDLNIAPIENCDFCNYKEKTPENRIEHACGAVSVPNKYPWERYDWITLYPPFGEHKLLLSDLFFDDMERMIESSYDLTCLCAKDPSVLGFMDFTNWGPFAGASQQHPHSQRKSVTSHMDPRQDRELSHCRQTYGRLGANPFDLLMEEERSRGERVIHDNDVFIAAAFAPSCPDEILVFPKEPVSHILQMDGHMRRKIIRPVLGIFPALFFYRGISDLNIAVHMAPFGIMEEARKYFRWHLHIMPRRSRLPADRAGAEIGFETYIIDTPPEKTATELRHWYNHGPMEDHITKRKDGTPSPEVVAAFRRMISANR